ncbi:tol-pal system YbgF family protein [Mariniflexile gromovii]|uniref:Tetratricopeptide repeat protein n=1 Tax=Mariniflexile gromovii TaxID=362523 RepID=A0ABS4BV79_9FLAO|nr:tetratricopeptide repeat protein [Mariniflexile gromovii]MBP0904488.1 tetratricopeptide repeat protein [Mariniflexile gromovii]
MKDNSNISQEIIEAIERYLNGTMEADELKDFNDYLKIDAEFKAQVNEYKRKFQDIEPQASNEQLEAFHDEIPKTDAPQKAPKKGRYLFFSKVAAAAAILIAIGSIWFFSESPNQKIYAKYFKPDPGLATTKNKTINFEFYDAMADYKLGNYSSAIAKWLVLGENKPEKDTLNYFIGMAHLANKNINEAIPFLEKTIETTNPDFAFLSNAYFYLGLAYIKNGNLNLAKKYLTLSKNDTSKEVLKNLD